MCSFPLGCTPDKIRIGAHASYGVRAGARKIVPQKSAADASCYCPRNALYRYTRVIKRPTFAKPFASSFIVDGDDLVNPRPPPSADRTTNCDTPSRLRDSWI